MLHIVLLLWMLVTPSLLVFLSLAICMEYCQAQPQPQPTQAQIRAEFSIIPQLSSHPTRPDHPTTRPDPTRRNSRFGLDQTIFSP